ncbi:MAG: class I SAM-dependent methyltransferase [Deltaproteobacteria bacterium]|jgi:SAM-dependent methyltransferase|nr:class I SAM-dependent methyltransferase [Deltaproteobacteria bacterium]
MTKSPLNCPICGAGTDFVGQIFGRIPPNQAYFLRHCPKCHFSYISNPRDDYATIYSEEYYRGLGADPLVNYEFDHQMPDLTLRQYEWAGLSRIFKSLFKASYQKATWLDYGCGLGSLVAYGRKRGLLVSGYEPYGDPLKDSLSENKALTETNILSTQDLAGREFDFVTAIEVIEHAADPLAFLAQIRPLIKPGGFLFLTTGNAKPFRSNLIKWSYVSCPDVHVSFFEPETLALALSKNNFRPFNAGFLPGFAQVIKYKILKNLKFKKRSLFFDLCPFSAISFLTNLKYQVTAMPIGIAE